MKNTLLAASLLFISYSIAQAEPPAIAPQLATRWTAEVSATEPWPEYPRPQLVREGWTNLNGVWQYAIQSAEVKGRPTWKEEIVVPFCVESALSRVKKPVSPDQALWYRRTFAAPTRKATDRTHLHFGAVDWEATVWVNGKEVGKHRGGYDPFSFEITDAIRDGENEIVVRVLDPTDRGTQPRGKQVLKPEGIWYTAVTGIWQTVWLEVTPASYIRGLTIAPNAKDSSVTITVDADADPSWDALVEIEGTGVSAKSRVNRPVTHTLKDAKLWSPENPQLYSVKVTLESPDGVRDRVESYFAFRTIEVGPDAKGVTRLLLNGEPLFQFGPLDQGWWPDGLYTAPCDEALRYDVEMTKKLGFNMARKHVKVEPARWYYWCDKLGLLVWQDMPSGDRSISGEQPDIKRTKESAAEYEKEWQAIIDSLRNHPSIVMWVPFNEGWGQFDTARIAELTKKHDPTRLVNSASGWTDRSVGDVHDIHVYPGPGSPKPELKRAAVLGEYGGLGLPLEGHTWIDKGNWGYKSYPSREELGKAYLELITKLEPLIANPGLSAAVYTQTTDVEVEVNGLMTYDRAITKLDEKTIGAANRRLWTQGVAPAASGEAQ